jgi:hypothetical protein
MNLKEFIQSEIKSQISEAKDMTFVDYLKVLDSKFLDGMKAVRGDNGSDAAITPTRGDILQNFKLFRNYLSVLTKKYKGDKTKLRFISEIKSQLRESVNEATKYKVGQKTPVGKIVGTSVWGKGRKQEWFYDVQKPGYSPKQYSEKSLDKIMGESLTEGKKKLPKFKNIPSWARYVAQQSDGEWTWYEETPTMIKFRDGSGGAWKQDGNQTYTGVKTDGKDWDKIPTYYNVKNGKITESEEQIDEKLITFSNRAPYGQIVFMAGGAGSGKGFAINNFIDSAGFKVRDVDEMKKAVGKLDQLGKFSVDKWYKKYGKKLSDKPGKDGGLSPKAHVEEFVLGKGMSISDISKDLKNPNNVASLHYIVDSMGLKDKWVINMLSGKTNKETLPNLLFDITAKKVSSITEVIKPLIANGYDSKNVHLIWVLKNYHAAVEANKERDRVVPDDILLQTHEGASKTMWQILTQIKPKGLDGRIDVILNNNKFTANFVDKNGKEIQVEPNQMNKLKDAQPVVSGFKSLPIKNQGGGIIPEKYWQGILKGWILTNTPDTIDFEELEKPPEEKKK